MTNSLDWIGDLTDRFGSDAIITNLKASKFHGSIQFNFHEGVVANYDLKIHRSYSVPTQSVSSTTVVVHWKKQPQP